LFRCFAFAAIRQPSQELRRFGSLAERRSNSALLKQSANPTTGVQQRINLFLGWFAFKHARTKRLGSRNVGDVELLHDGPQLGRLGVYALLDDPRQLLASLTTPAKQSELI
jgi:hypothetical protein